MRRTSVSFVLPALHPLLRPWSWFRPATKIGTIAALLLLVAACGSGTQQGPGPGDDGGTITLDGTETPPSTTPMPRLALAIDPAGVAMAPLPLGAGVPFTITALLDNGSDVLAEDVPVVVHIAAMDEELGYQPFLHVLTVTVPPSTSVPITVPVHWNLAAGEHRLWVHANRPPDAWKGTLPVQPEANLADNAVLVDLWIEPFDAQPSTLCAGRVDLEIEPTDILPEPDLGRVLVTIHNLGNRAVYNVPIVVFSTRASGLAYSPAIPPCGGTVRVPVELEGDLAPGDSLTVRINPIEWTSGIEEDAMDNNQVSVSAGFAPGTEPPAARQPADYDFWVDSTGIELAQPGVLVITVQNRGTRDADEVPVRIENDAGRSIVDVIPLVRGQGTGVAAIRITSLATRGGTLIVTINPSDVDGSYPESSRGDNEATFQLSE